MKKKELGREALARLVCANRGLQTGPYGNELSKHDYTAEGIPLVMPRDLVGGTIRRETLTRVSSSKAEELSRYRFEVGDVVLARRGKLGSCALIGDDEAGWLCGTGCFRVRLNDRLDPSYLVQYLRWEGVVHWLSGHAVGQTMANLNTEILSQVPVWVPTLEVQRRVVRLLDDLEKAIQLRQEIRDLELAFQATLLQDLFGAGEKSLHLPAGWRVRELGDLCQLVNGNRFHRDDWSDEGIPIIRIQNLNGSRNFKYFPGYIKNAWWVKTGDLLLPWAGSVASVKPYLWRGPRGVLNQHIFRLVPKKGINLRWLYEVLRSIAPQIQRLSQGFKENFVHLHKGDVKRYPIAVAPPRKQIQIAQWSRQLEESLEQRSAQVDLLKQLQRELRTDLFSGRKRIE